MHQDDRNSGNTDSLRDGFSPKQCHLKGHFCQKSNLESAGNGGCYLGFKRYRFSLGMCRIVTQAHTKV